MSSAAITGLGVVTPFGVGCAPFLDGLLRGAVRFAPYARPHARLPQAPDLAAALLDDFDPKSVLGPKGLRTLGADAKLTLAAATLACADAGLDPETWRREDVGVLTATTFAGLADYVELYADGRVDGVDAVSPTQGPQTGFNAPASQLSIRMKAEGPNLTFANGSTSGLDALAHAAELVRIGRASIVIVACAETIPAVAAHVLVGARGTDRPRPFDRARSGPAYAEAGVVLVVEPVHEA